VAILWQIATRAVRFGLLRSALLGLSLHHTSISQVTSQQVLRSSTFLIRLEKNGRNRRLTGPGSHVLHPRRLRNTDSSTLDCKSPSGPTAPGPSQPRSLAWPADRPTAPKWPFREQEARWRISHFLTQNEAPSPFRLCCPLLLRLIHWMRLPAERPERQRPTSCVSRLVFEESGGDVARPRGNLARRTSTWLSVPCFNGEILEQAAEVIARADAEQEEASRDQPFIRR
jgi:hypothetical protein